MNWIRLSAIVMAILGAAAARLLPHPPNFAPIGAMALFGGAYFGRSWLAFAFPFAALIISDVLLGFYSHMEIVYASFALVVMLGQLSLSHKSPMRVGVAAVASSVLFFIITNFGEWLYSGIYGHTLDGLMTCYAAAIPFFQNTLAGDLFYSTLLFGSFALLERAIPVLRTPPLPSLSH